MKKQKKKIPSFTLIELIAGITLSVIVLTAFLFQLRASGRFLNTSSIRLSETSEMHRYERYMRAAAASYGIRAGEGKKLMSASGKTLNSEKYFSMINTRFEFPPDSSYVRIHCGTISSSHSYYFYLPLCTRISD